jgi:hypothetical protein
MELSKDQLTKEQRRQLKARRRLEKNLGAKEVSKTSSDDQLLEPVTILCVRFGNKYGREYVERLRNMVSKNLRVPYEFVCLTDDKHPIEGVRTLYQPASNYQKLWWHKIHMFDNNLPLKGKIIYFDLDVIVHNNIEKIINFQFKNLAGIRDFNRKFYPSWQYLNSSVMAWFHGTQHHIYESFKKDQATAMRLQGDQDYIWKLLKNKITFWPEKWIQSYKWEIRRRDELTMVNGKRNFRTIFTGHPDSECCVTVFHGDPKPQDIKDPFVVDNWL